MRTAPAVLLSSTGPVPASCPPDQAGVLQTGAAGPDGHSVLAAAGPDGQSALSATGPDGHSVLAAAGPDGHSVLAATGPDGHNRP